VTAIKLNSSNQTLQQLVKKAERLLDLNQRLLEQLATPLKEHCKLANWRNGCLVIETDSAVWATQLRYSSPDLLERLRKIPEFYGLCSIHCYIRPAVSVADAEVHSSMSLSPENAELIAATASGIEDKALSSALQRLARQKA